MINIYVEVLGNTSTKLLLPRYNSTRQAAGGCPSKLLRAVFSSRDQAGTPAVPLRPPTLYLNICIICVPPPAQQTSAACVCDILLYVLGIGTNQCMSTDDPHTAVWHCRALRKGS